MKEEDLNYKMEKAISHLEKEFQSIRTSRANPSLLDNILVESYGNKTPINQLGNISVQESNIKPYEGNIEEKKEDVYVNNLKLVSFTSNKRTSIT